MIIIINGTNRKTSLSRPVSDFVFNLLKENYSGGVEFLDLSDISLNSYDSQSMYHSDSVSDEIRSIQTSLLIPSSKMVFISPEYNGSIPGILKLFIDACSIKDAKASFYHKKACLIGVASGRAGNLRGLEHLTGILMYMNMIIYPNKMPISRIESLIDSQGRLTDASTQEIIRKLMDEFIEF
ncbi:MAG: NAD(P)H-dependent oxidoreductase [Saprospiraceae bacterium]